jgi:hypothetical protein
MQMGRKQKKTGNILLLLAVLFPGLGACLFAQKPMVSLTVSDKKVAPDESITVIITTNLNGTFSIDYPVEFSADYSIMHGMEPRMDPSTGKISSHYFMQQSGSFRKEGSYSFYAYVKYQGANYRSNKITITVSEDENADDENLGYNSKEPIFGVIQAKKTTVYEGEPVLLKAKVFSRYDIYFLEAYKPFKADKNAEEHIFQSQRQNVEETRFNGKTMLTFDYGKQLIFPVATGKCRIQPFEMALRCRTRLFDKTVSFKSSSATINVKPLPDGAPRTFIGGVGEFGLHQQLGNTRLKQGDVFRLTLVVDGLGNLHNINAPVLSLPNGCTVYGDPERQEDHHFTEEGVEGTITFVYNIRVTKSGKVPFDAQAISYFDPEAEEYVTVRAEPFTLEVEKDASYQPIVDNSRQDSQPQDLSIRQASGPSKREEKSNASTLVVSIATPICLLGLFLFLFLGKRKRKQEVAAGQEQEKVILPIVPSALEDYWKTASESLDDPNKFAIVLPKAIIQRLEKHFGAGLSREKAMSLLADRNEDTARALRRVIDTCDQFRYGFGDADFDPHALFAEADALLKAV